MVYVNPKYITEGKTPSKPRWWQRRKKGVSKEYKVIPRRKFRSYKSIKKRWYKPRPRGIVQIGRERVVYKNWYKWHNRPTAREKMISNYNRKGVQVVFTTKGVER